jgi:hypothetical protein
MAHNAGSVYSVEAETALGQAVKLNPGLTDAWDALGECYWKKGDTEQRSGRSRYCWLLVVFV